MSESSNLPRILLFVNVLLLACSHQGSSPFAAASGVTRADDGAKNRQHRIIPLRPMQGDVEILYGDPEKPGEPFVMRIRELPGTIVPPHSHPVDEHITVISGTWYFALGDKFDRDALKEIRTGGYAFAPKGSTMFGYSPDGAVVQVHGVGPFHIHWLHGVATLDSPNAAALFAFRKDERIDSPRGKGTIRQGYASGQIVQYEIAADDGMLFMVNQDEMRRVTAPPPPVSSASPRRRAVRR